MKRRLVQLPSCLIIAALLTFWAIPSAGQAAQSQPTEYSGQATVLKATVLGVSTELITAGPLPPQGGQDEASLFSATVPGLFQANLLHASTLGIGPRSQSEASVANLVLTPPGHVITADFVMSQAVARCTSQGATATGRSFLTQLVVDGTPITVGTAPNQVIPLPGGGQIIINEQQKHTIGNKVEITVNAIHVMIPRVADVIVASAYADIRCGGHPGGRDCATGAGFIKGTPTGANGQFAFMVGIVFSVPFWGHFMYEDQGSSLQVVGTGITAYVVVNTTTRHFEGPAQINGQGGFTYKVDIVDKGESGSQDTFAITLSNGYSASGVLAGGNITMMHNQMR